MITPIQIEKWMLFCMLRHESVGQRYGTNQKHSYSFHLKTVVDNARQFKHLLRRPDLSPKAALVAAGHDLIEDTRLTYNNVIEELQRLDIIRVDAVEIADAIFSCTELRGKSRPERHGESFWELLRKDELGAYVKLCDIYANMLYSSAEGSRFLDTYQREWQTTRQELGSYSYMYKELFELIEKLAKRETDLTLK